MKKIGYLGPKGTFSQEALEVYIKNMRQDFSAVEEVAVDTIADLIWSVQRGELDEAVIPMENSIEGAVNITLDMLALDVDLLIQGEIVIPICQNLVARKGTKRSSIKCILSHPQGLGQCRRYIENNYPGAELRYTYSTAEGAMEVASGNGCIAAVASRKAAEVYGLEILDENIQDGNNNHTRFVVIGRNESPPGRNDKTSIVFSAEDKPGSLYRILDIFNLWDINMARIESRPAKNQLGKYIFFVDLLGHKDNEDINAALTMVKRKTSMFKLLGSYPIL